MLPFHRLVTRLPVPAVSVLIPQGVAGIVTGLILTTDAIAVGLILVAGLPVQMRSAGILIALLSTAITSACVTLYSASAIAVVGPSIEAAAILSSVANALYQNLVRQGAEGAIIPTIWGLFGISSLLTGGCLWGIGRFRLSRILQFVPYPVLGGFLAGVGWLVVQAGFGLIVNDSEGMALIRQLIQPDTLLKLLPGLGFLAMLMWVDQRFKHYLALPLCLVLAIALSHGLLWVLGVPLSEAIAQGWFLEPVKIASVDVSFSPQFWSQLDFGLLLQHSGDLVGILLLVPLVLMLEAIGLDIAFNQESDIDHELRVNGATNLLIGAAGGTLCHLDLANTLIHHKAGATMRLAGLLASGVIAAILLVGGDLTAYIPTAVVFALTLLAGIELLIEWVYQSWFHVSRLEYALIVIILGMIVVFDFLPGVAFGVLAACIVFVVNYSRIRVVRYAISGADHPSNVQRSPHLQKLLRYEGQHVYILHLQGYLFFGTATSLLAAVRQRVEDSAQPAIQFLVLNFRSVSGVDSSAVLCFVKLKQLALKEQFQLVMTDVRSPIQQQLQQGGYLEPDDTDCHILPTLDQGVEWCENQILARLPIRRQRVIPLVLQLQELFPNDDSAPRLMNYLEEQDAEPGHYLFHQGDTPDALYFVESGQISLLLELADGTIQRLQTIGAGNIVGERALYGRTAYASSAMAEQPSTLYCLSSKSLNRLETEAPQLAFAFHKFVLRNLSEQLSHRENELKQLLQSS